MEVTVICSYIMHCIHYMLICIIIQSVELVFVISWVSQGLDSVTVSQPWLIALAWPWLYQISHKPHPIVINIVKVLQCHQISTFCCVINSSGCIIDKWKHKSMAAKIFHNPADHGCHFYEKFRILHGKCWRTVYTQVVDVSEIIQVRAVNKWYFLYKNKCVYT